jgi:hypothetical protein
MDRLRDLRFNLQLEVKVWGLDELGKPFAHPAQTIEVGALGARLCRISGVRQDDVIGIQYRNQKARFRVVWIGACKSEQEGQVGVECIEPGKCIWTAALDAAQSCDPDSAPVPARHDLAAGSAAAQLAWPACERRRYPRYHCSGTITLKRESGEVLTALKLLDLSLGGCYGETLSPFPVGARMRLLLNVGEIQITVAATVVTSHASIGNGFGFTEIIPEEWKKLAKAVQQLGSGKVVSDVVTCPELIDGLEALIAVLQRRGILSREEVLGELARRISAR